MIQQATLIGRTHRLFARNGQDAAYGAQLSPDRAYGLVLDGCGASLPSPEGTQPSRSELGALLLGQFLVGQLDRLAGSDKPLTAGIDELAGRTHRFLAQVSRAVGLPAPARRRFVATCLLTTVVGFVLRPEQALLFWAGDGICLVNDRVLRLEADNRPDYPAYALFDGITRPFALLTVCDRPALRRLAVATDGWEPSQLSAVPARTNSLLLQRWLNQEGGRRGQFEDDAAVVAWHADGAEEHA
jgi:hypothetical protein